MLLCNYCSHFCKDIILVCLRSDCTQFRTLISKMNFIFHHQASSFRKLNLSGAERHKMSGTFLESAIEHLTTGRAPSSFESGMTKALTHCTLLTVRKKNLKTIPLSHLRINCGNLSPNSLT